MPTTSGDASDVTQGRDDQGRCVSMPSILGDTCNTTPKLERAFQFYLGPLTSGVPSDQPIRCDGLHCRVSMPSTSGDASDIIATVLAGRSRRVSMPSISGDASDFMHRRLRDQVSMPSTSDDASDRLIQNVDKSCTVLMT